jgi:hypothetical protein
MNAAVAIANIPGELHPLVDKQWKTKPRDSFANWVKQLQIDNADVLEARSADVVAAHCAIFGDPASPEYMVSMGRRQGSTYKLIKFASVLCTLIDQGVDEIA